ncbi:MAG: ATP-dependent RecD-like DNA helicase [Acholeplasmataceae bacterium]
MPEQERCETEQGEPKHPELSEEQQAALSAVLQWLAGGKTKELTLGGFAGSGKTTLIRTLLTEHAQEIRDATGGDIAVAAFTGKACSVLRSKGLVEAQTLHSLLYEPRKEAKGRVRFEPKPTLMGVKFLVVDEASMISKELYADIGRHRIHVLWVGDMGQLEPIGENPRLMADPQVRLVKIHRQAEKSAIIQFSFGMRSGFAPAAFRTPNPEEARLGDWHAFVAAVKEGYQGLCGWNKTRHLVNNMIREHLDFRGVVAPGERVICLRNNRQLGVWNGLIGEVCRVHDADDDAVIVDIQEEGTGEIHEGVEMDTRQFGADKSDAWPPPTQERTYWDYGYVITTHKSQGSEFDRVAVFEELASSWDARRWRYTAATRAVERLLYCW